MWQRHGFRRRGLKSREGEVRAGRATGHESVRRESLNVKRSGEKALGRPTFHLSRFLGAMRECRMGIGAFLGKESTLADSGWAGVVAAGVGQVRKAAFS